MKADTTDCGTCALCDGSGTCDVYDATQDADCPATECADSCTLTPDGDPFTWDFADDVPNTCSALFSCTSNSCSYEHECRDNDPDDGINGNQCGAACDQDSDCDDGKPGTLDICQNNCTCKHINEDCTNGLDDDDDGFTDCADSDCIGQQGPLGSTCCAVAGDCTQDDCVIESCDGNNECAYANRAQGATDECSTCEACDVAGGNCADITANAGKNCDADCTSCLAGSCDTRVQDDNTEVAQACYYCDGTNTASQTFTGDNGVNCNDECTLCNAGSCDNRPADATDECSTCEKCNAGGGDCAGITADDGKDCNDECTSCVAGSCDNRPADATDECGTCEKCNAGGGDCAAVTAENGKN